jgi:hypothetical protein
MHRLPDYSVCGSVLNNMFSIESHQTNINNIRCMFLGVYTIAPSPMDTHAVIKALSILQVPELQRHGTCKERQTVQKVCGMWGFLSLAGLEDVLDIHCCSRKWWSVVTAAGAKKYSLSGSSAASTEAGQREGLRREANRA